MSDWITDRLPTIHDVPPSCDVVFDSQGRVVFSGLIAEGEAWKPITAPEPYVKPKRYVIRCYGDFGLPGPAGFWCVYDTVRNVSVSDFMPREAAERIAAAYEEVMP